MAIGNFRKLREADGQVELSVTCAFENQSDQVLKIFAMLRGHGRRKAVMVGEMKIKNIPDQNRFCPTFLTFNGIKTKVIDRDDAGIMRFIPCFVLEMTIQPSTSST